MAHDLRTPIKRLRLHAEFVDDPVQQAKMLTDLDEMEAMIDAALAFAREETILENVFRPFHRLEPSRSRDTGGTGLGLSVARSVVRSHGGEVTLANRTAGCLVQTVVLPRQGTSHTAASWSRAQPAARAARRE